MDVSIRRDRETGRPVLFFWNSSPCDVWLQCYDRIGQHSKCSESYRLFCAPIRKPDPEALALLCEWSTLGPPEDWITPRVVQRLARPQKDYTVTRPRFWRVAWCALGTVPAGHADYTQRARAKGFYLIRKSQGFIVTITPAFTP